MKPIIIWIKSIFIWLIKWRYFCIGLLFVILPIWIIIHYEADQDTIKIFGMILQLLGIGTVLWDINSTRKQFDQPNIIKVWYERLISFPRIAKQGNIGNLNVELPQMSGSARIYQTESILPEATTEERLMALEKNLEIAHKRISQTQSEIDQIFKNISDDLKLEKQVRDMNYEELNSKIETTETSGLHILGMGALWLFEGVIMSTVPTKIFELLR